MTWSLKELYSDFDSPEFSHDFYVLEEHIRELSELTKHLSTLEDVETYFKLSEMIRKLASKLNAFSSLTFSTNTGHEDALKARSKLQVTLSGLTPSYTRMIAFISSIDDLDAFINGNDYLSAFAFKLMEMKTKSKHMLSEAEEILASKLAITGSSSWSTLQSKLTSTLTATVEIDDKLQTMPIASVRNLASHTDAKVRKAAYEAELSAYKKIDEAVSMCLNSIKGEVITLSQLRGYDSPLQMTLQNTRMTSKTLEAMLSAIEESIPLFQDYLSAKATLLGHSNGLPFYDLFAPLGSHSKTYTFEEGSRFVLDNFASYSQKLYDVAKHAIDHQWIDVEPREGKVSGAFCSSLHPLGEFRVMLNYTGTLGDVTTMAHELGHGYHAMCTNHISILNTDYPMPLAETASTFCETIVNQAAIELASPDEAFTILENSLQDATQVICDIYSRFLFESSLFKNRTDHPLSVQELNDLMQDAQKKAYGKGLDHSFLHPYMWLIKPHYYSAALNFYNYPYAFGLLFAKGLYALYLEKPDFFKSTYDDLLAASGSMSIVDVCKIMHIDVEDVNFWRSSLAIVTKDIHSFIALAKELT